MSITKSAPGRLLVLALGTFASSTALAAWGEATVPVWTARNAALDFFRHERLAPFDPIGEKADQCVLDTETDVAATVSRQQELQLLSDAMQALPSRCRQVFTLRKLYGLSHHEIAAQLGISERTVEAQIDKAMRRCAAFLRERGLP